MLTEAMVAAAAAGGTAVVEAAGSDLWAWFRTRCARLVGRGDPGREDEALDRLDRTAAVLDAADEDEREQVRDRHARLWQGEFSSLLESLEEADRERSMAELRSLKEEFGDGVAGVAVSGNTFHGPVAFQTGSHSRQDNHFGTAG
ncbi:hypothetical protein OG883_17065 [Streptomyces sp. NBC_01142]|uniref:hypothetical protein n=1 Tax=Streptomyces sp. NBC_01142 TaxID=2975865 RepID=UPI0022531A69|nr:hypothetical protein [Streptomyces sp. NBC_01142]MCX4821572.1 hypothetical protein [Streptomyces sp. NBC_01142]